MYNVNWNKIYLSIKDFMDNEDDRAKRNTPFKIKDILKKYGMEEQHWISKDIVRVFSNIKPVKNSDGVYSPSLTLKGIPDEIDTPYGPLFHLQDLVRVIAYYSRSNLFYHVPTEYCALVPLVLKALKIYHRVNYNSWDKSDKAIRAMLGYRLSDIVDYSNDMLPYSEEVRNDIMTIKTTGVVKSPDRYPTTRKITIGNKQVKTTDIPVIIRYQLWNAHAANRQEYMILDLDDWDAIPEPYDVVDYRKEVVKNSKRRNEDLPF